MATHQRELMAAMVRAEAVMPVALVELPVVLRAAVVVVARRGSALVELVVPAALPVLMLRQHRMARVAVEQAA